MERKKISVVVSVYNEELSLNQFYKTTVSVLDKCVWDYELIFVNDGSQDGSIELLKGFAKENAKVKVVDFSRNFGHEAAMIAGIDHAQGDGVVCMDADLQHPPACIPDIIAKFEDGYEVISMIRTKNADAGIIKRITSGAFYKVLNLMSPVKFENNSSDFFAISKNVAGVLRKDYREKIRYLRGYVQSVGFRKTTLEFEAQKREAGESKYSIRKLLHFSINALCSLSTSTGNVRPNNPTGAAYTREQLKAWVDYAKKNNAVILYDAAYECFITDPALARSIFEVEGARECAIEICSFSKIAGRSEERRVGKECRSRWSPYH